MQREIGMPNTESIWNLIRNHTWKYKERTEPIRLIIIHTTRGPVSMNLQYPATKNWFISRDNRSADGTWASVASKIVGADGTLCEVMPDDYYPTWSAGHMDPIAISYELAQPDNNTPLTEACLDRAAREIARDCFKYDIPAWMLPYVSADNHEAPGIARHDRSANGDYWGKSDPGDLFGQDLFEDQVYDYLENMKEDVRMNAEEECELALRRVAATVQVLLADLKFQEIVDLFARLGIKPSQ